jgi:hypothetical protein
MAELVFKEFICEVDTDELGDDSPYFLTWVGNLRDPDQQTVIYTREARWDNKVNAGSIVTVGRTIASEPAISLSPATTMALALMIEKDQGADLTATEARQMDASNDAHLVSVREAMKKLLITYQSMNADPRDANVLSNFRNTFATSARGLITGTGTAKDELMEEDGWHAARRIDLARRDDLIEVQFRGSGGRYRARYRIV